MTFRFDFTEAKLKLIIPRAPNIQKWFKALYTILPYYEITSIPRVACFLGQTSHESMGYTVLRENLNYSATALNRVFNKYFPTIESAKGYERQPERIANKVYANRMGNGTIASGDGWKYRGRGLIQLTGKNNYVAFANSLNIELEQVTPLLETYEGAVLSACFYWNKVDLNKYADMYDIKTMTKKINGGYIGLEERIELINKSAEILRGH